MSERQNIMHELILTDVVPQGVRVQAAGPYVIRYLSGVQAVFFIDGQHLSEEIMEKRFQKTEDDLDYQALGGWACGEHTCRRSTVGRPSTAAWRSAMPVG